MCDLTGNIPGKYETNIKLINKAAFYNKEYIQINFSKTIQ
jgi:hypothetical protein